MNFTKGGREGDRFNDRTAFLIQYRIYIIVIALVIGVIAIDKTWALWFALVSGLLFFLTANRYYIVNLRLGQILRGVCHICNHFEEPKWGFKISKNRSKKVIKAKFVYDDRFSWKDKEFEIGPAFYLSFNHHPFAPDIFKRVHDFCKDNSIGFESDGEICVLGKKKDRSSRAISFDLMVGILKIYFSDEELSQYYSIRVKDPIIDKGPGRQLVGTFYSTEATPFKVKAIDKDFFNSISDNARW